MNIKIDQAGKTAIYKQLVAQIEHGIKDGSIKPGELLPSMNELSASMGISKETVKKSYGILVEKGIIIPKQGKGFFVANPGDSSHIQVLLVFDKFSVYKQILYNAFAEILGDKAEITILNHNQSVELLEYYLDNYLDQFDYYVIAPHFPLDEQSQQKVTKLLKRVPYRKLILLDRLQPGMSGNFGAVYQDFDNDILIGLQQLGEDSRDTVKLRVITLSTSLYGSMICKGVERYSKTNGLNVEYLTKTPESISKGDLFLVLNSQLDSGLVALARIIQSSGLTIGKDVYIVSYNEYDMNELILGGLTTLSTDFPQMGRLAAEMILKRKMEKLHCPFRATRRHTF